MYIGGFCATWMLYHIIISMYMQVPASNRAAPTVGGSLRCIPASPEQSLKNYMGGLIKIACWSV